MPTSDKPARKAPPPSLEQLLRRSDIWRGHSQVFVHAPAIDSGYPQLNQALQHGGWPAEGIIEVCQAFYVCEWWLFHPAIKAVMGEGKLAHLALLNPPALPFIAALETLGIASERVLVVQTRSPQEYVGSFTELSRCPICPVVMAWQGQLRLNYTQLRKLQLNASETKGLYLHFRPERVRQHSSPASVRLQLNPDENCIELDIFKQKGKLHGRQVEIGIPQVWKKQPLRHHLQGPDAVTQHAQQAGSKGQLALFPGVNRKEKAPRD